LMVLIMVLIMVLLLMMVLIMVLLLKMVLIMVLLIHQNQRAIYEILTILNY
jgi:hypothetical protein